MSIPAAGSPLPRREFANLMQELQFAAEVEKKAKKENEDKPEDATPPAAEPGAAVASSLNTKVATQGV